MYVNKGGNRIVFVHEIKNSDKKFEAVFIKLWLFQLIWLFQTARQALSLNVG